MLLVCVSDRELLVNARKTETLAKAHRYHHKHVTAKYNFYLFPFISLDTRPSLLH